MLLALRFVRLPALRAERPRLEAVDEGEVSVVTQVSDLGRVVCDAQAVNEPHYKIADLDKTGVGATLHRQRC